jgi:hypothetical protein
MKFNKTSSLLALSSIVYEKIEVEGFCLGASGSPTGGGAPPDQAQMVVLDEHYNRAKRHRGIPTKNDGIDRSVNTPFPSTPEKNTKKM